MVIGLAVEPQPAALLVGAVASGVVPGRDRLNIADEIDLSPDRWREFLDGRRVGRYRRDSEQ
ncbi:MAG TPA: hypothetical protein VNK04_16930 [Gemmataceae bacterium]|nr:hypothetical protein [Gemmataceae bacterium]